MDFRSFLEKTAAQADRQLESILPKKADEKWISATLGKPEFGFDANAVQAAIIAPSWDFLGRGGKRWRPALMLLACRAVGGSKEEALPFIAIPELVHNGTIVVDDVEDGSVLRRGKKALHLIYGIDVAVNAGNAMYYLPLAGLIQTDKLSAEKKSALFSVYAREMLRLSFGQAMDIQWHKGGSEVSEAQYLQMCSYKTGSLARMAVRMGAILGNASKGQESALEEFATSIGVAFQIQDDVLNVRPPEGWGKEIGDDINEGKMTLMVIHCLSKLAKAKAKRLREILAKEKNAKQEIAEAISLLEETGSVDYACGYAKEFVSKTWSKLDSVIPDSSAKELLRGFADYVIERKI